MDGIFSTGDWHGRTDRYPGEAWFFLAVFLGNYHALVPCLNKELFAPLPAMR
jgi:hypothetical protein